MRWYLNEVSLQGQYANPQELLEMLGGLIALRQRFDRVRDALYVARGLGHRDVRQGQSLSQLLFLPANQGVRALVLRWLNSAGPFVDDDRLVEEDDYFEFESKDVTDTGLGEAARRVKAREQAGAFSFAGGPVNFVRSPLLVDHGIPDCRLGQHEVPNVWTLEDLRAQAEEATPPPSSWRELVQTARARFPKLWLPDEIYLNGALRREAFNSVIRDRTLELLARLNSYMEARLPDGSDGAVAKRIVEDYFTGDRAAFSPESPTNQREFREALTFPDPENAGHHIFADWHGKISHRFFRLHFEWPAPSGAERLKVLYLGPKITKD